MTPALPALTATLASGTRQAVAALQQLPTVPGVDALPNLVVVLAFVLLVGGIVGSVAPVVPSGLLSLFGVLTYWFATGFRDPGFLVLTGLVFVSVVAMAAEWLSGAVSAKAGGASTKTTLLATLVGFLGLVLVGPAGFILGTAGTVFGLTYAENEDAEASARAAGVTILGMVTSSLVQLLLTAGVFVVMVLVLVF